MAKKLKEYDCMYRKEFVARLSNKLMSDEETADEITTAFLSVLEDTWSEGRTVRFPHFGVFEVRIITEKMGRNPKTMEEHLIPASYKPAFRPTKDLREKISSSIQQKSKKDSTS